MIPRAIKFKIPRREKRPLTLYFPFVLIWLLILPFLILALPFLLLAALLTWRQGYGRFLLVVYPMIFEVLLRLQGLLIDVESSEERVYIEVL